jgi:succinate dehydrogenase hydrophobic anchor subunit
MKAYGLAIVVFLEWALAIPVIFHALNGGRLILYEFFSMRNDESMIRWMTALSILYIAMLALLMMMGSQEVSAFFFWLISFVIALIAGYGVAMRMGFREHSIFWRLQRISGVFLLVMVPAHLIFMHLNPSVSKDANIVISRMQNYFIKGTDICLILGALYHGAYGVVSLAKDYLSSGVVRIGIMSFIALVMLVFAWAGIKLTFTI